MDRVAIAREERRRQVTDDLQFERDRAGELHEEIKRLVLELEEHGIDAEVFARMPAEDVELIRGGLQGVDREVVEEDWLDFGDETDEEGRLADEQLEAELRAEQEAEIVRLQEEIVASERRQQALEAYLEALGSLG